jgi:hypothetical protein
MADMDDRREYDEPVCLVFCSRCGSSLELDDSCLGADGWVWWCPGCECYYMDQPWPVPVSRS